MQEFWVYIFLIGKYEKCAKLKASEDAFYLEYVEEYLNNKNKVDIDPQNLPAYPKEYENEEELFTVLTDSAPDFWGRQLLNQKFNVQELNELEYVLANGLEHVGALAYSPVDYDEPMQLTKDGWKPHSKRTIDLETIIEQTELMIQDADKAKMKELFEFGPTLGGGKPKVSLNLDGIYYLAKYGTSLDSFQEQRVEFAVMKMATDLNFNVPEIQLASHANRDVYFIKRFDRELIEGSIVKHHFVSALSLCGWHVYGNKDWSYPMFTEFIRKVGKTEKHIREDLEELFRRVAFNIAVNNDDDHPRNHGLLCRNGEWRLSPLYDVMPKAVMSSSFSMVMGIGSFGTEASKKNLMSISSYFDLDDETASKLIDEIFTFVSKNWKEYFREAKVNESTITQFENAFSMKL